VGFSGDKDSSEIFYHFVSFLIPGLIYHFDFAQPSAESTIFKEVKIANFDRDVYIVEQKFYPSKDGEKIPMFIIRKKGNEIQPKPCLLYGYGEH
jgi:prolyl oligopeptidase